MDADSVAHDTTVSNLRNLYNEESELQRRHYETTLEQHMRKAIAAEESFNESFKLQQEEFDRQLDDVRASFAETESYWQVHCARLEIVIDTVHLNLWVAVLISFFMQPFAAKDTSDAGAGR